MLTGGFPEDHVMKLEKKILVDNFDIKEGQDYLRKALEDSKSFITEGRGLVFYGDHCEIGASFLIYNFLVNDYTTICRYLSGEAEPIEDDIDADVLVIDCSTIIGTGGRGFKDNTAFTAPSVIANEKNKYIIESLLTFRERKVLSTILCIPDLGELEHWENLVQLLGLEDGKFTGEIYRGIKVAFKKGKGRWG